MAEVSGAGQTLVARLDQVARFRWAVVSAWLALVAGMSVLGIGDGDWEFFRRADRALLGRRVFGSPGGIHLYASRPDTQIGPPGLLAALPFHWLPQPWDVQAARFVMCLGLLLILWLTERLCQAVGVSDTLVRRGVLLGGLVVVPAWVAVAVTYTHLDDVLVLAFSVSAMLLVARDRPLWAGTAVGLAIAAKPWGVVIAPILLLGGWRAAIRPAALAGVVTLTWWLPFLADPKTWTALWHFRLSVDAASGLTLLGVHAGPMPGWDRPAQLLGGVLLGVIATRRGQWTGVLAVGLATRVALDPAAFSYYDIGPVLGALVWDLTRTRSGIPWASGLTMAGLSLATTVTSPATVGLLRLATCTALILAVLFSRRSTSQVDADLDRAAQPASV